MTLYPSITLRRLSSPSSTYTIQDIMTISCHALWDRHQLRFQLQKYLSKEQKDIVYIMFFVVVVVREGRKSFAAQSLSCPLSFPA
jgi:hypothetical protein